MNDILDRLAAANPAVLDITLSDEAASELRAAALAGGSAAHPAEGGATCATVGASVLPHRRRGRRTPLIVGTAAALAIGGATAVAGSRASQTYVGGAADGVTCVTSWTSEDPATQYGGPALTLDPVADCARYAELTGKGAIVDPVVTSWQHLPTVVGPRASRPDDAVLVPDLSPAKKQEEAALVELQQSFADAVDGGQSHCLTTAAAQTFAAQEVTRVGLGRSAVPVREQSPAEGPCALPMAHADGTVEVRAHSSADGGLPRAVQGRVDRLRTQVAQGCLTLPEAVTVTERILGPEDHWPTSPITDPGARCTRIDVVIGGSIQVFLRGPA